MKAEDAQEHFLAFISADNASLDSLSPLSAVELMAGFYAQVRADDCALEHDGDMLLFQWGTYDWGNGELFEYNITRQFILSPSLEAFNAEEDYGDDGWIGQLALTLKYHPSAALRNVAAGNRWCAHPDELSDFVTFIQNCEATTQVAGQPIAVTELTFNNAE